MIRAMVFDIGGVVCSFEPERRLKALADATGLEPDAINGALWGSGLDEQAESGSLSPAELERALLDALQHRLSAVSLRKAWSAAFAPDPAVCDVIRRLPRPTFAFTNNGPLFTRCLAHELIDVDQLFQRVICSWHLRARKPDAIAFERLCAAIRIEPRELIFVDDNEDNVSSARAVGLTAVRFATSAGLADDLSACDVRA